MKKYNQTKGCILILFIFLMGQMNLLAITSENEEIVPLVYEIKKKQYKSEEGGIEKNGKLYVEINEIAKLLKVYIEYKEHTLYLNTEEIETNTLFFEEATIIKVDKEHHQFTILPKGYEDVTEHLITIMMGKETKIEYPLLERIFPFDVLKEGMKVSISCLTEKMQTLPYYEASAIEIVANDATMKGLLPSIEEVYIIAINKEKQYIIVSETKGDTEHKESQIMVHVDHHTNIKNKEGKNDYKLAYLKLGQKVTIITNGIKTKSVPVQTLGLEIILLE